MILPNLILPGAQKGASTTLWQLLVAHEDIYGGREKEPHFFSRDDLYKQGLTYYSDSQYPGHGEQRYVLDASQSYLSLSEFVPERIFHNLGTDLRLVITLRNPVDRMESAFKHFRELPEREMERSMLEIIPDRLDDLTLDELLNYEKKAVNEALSAGRIIGRNPTWARFGFPYRYAYAGCYSIHLSRYFEYFPRDRFLFLSFEEITRRQVQAMRKVETFLDLPENSLTPGRPLRSSRIKIYKSERVGRAMRIIKGLAKPLVPTQLKNRLTDVERKYLLTDDTYKFPPAVYNRLLHVFEQEIIRTSEMTGHDGLLEWLAPRSERELAAG